MGCVGGPANPAAAARAALAAVAADLSAASEHVREAIALRGLSCWLRLNERPSCRSLSNNALAGTLPVTLCALTSLNWLCVPARTCCVLRVAAAALSDPPRD